jgi:hypothetical protein
LLLARDRSGTTGRIAGGKSNEVPSAKDHPAILPDIERAVDTIGYGKK